MDGAIRFVSETIDTQNLGADYPLHQPSSDPTLREMHESPYGVWGALSTKASGESKSL
jgi:hypothetical protein